MWCASLNIIDTDFELILMNLFWIYAVLLTVFYDGFHKCYGIRYDGFALLEISPRTSQHLESLKEFANLYKDDEIGFRFLRQPYKQPSKVYVIISPPIRQKLQKLLIHLSIESRIVVGDYQRLIDRESADNQRARLKALYRSQGNSDHTAYLRYEEIESWLAKKVSLVRYANFSRFGETVENRKLFMIKISKNASLPIVWLDGGIHAREWISTSSVLFVIDMLLQDTRESREVLSKYQFVIVPSVNPDGYEYTHETDRMWRKNRVIYPSSRCVGVDLNRNYPFQWGSGSSSEYPCHDAYRGPETTSENEIQAITKEMSQMKDSLILVLSIHSFGQYIFQPYNFSPSYFPRNYLDMTSVAMRAAYNVYKRHGTVYSVGRAPELLYSASGSSDDFAVGALGVPFSFTVELPDKGLHGFVLPPRYIKSVGQELWDIVRTLAEDISLTSSYFRK